MCTCLYTSLCACLCTVHARAYAHIACVYADVHNFIHLSIHISAHVHTCPYMELHTCLHTCLCACPCTCPCTCSCTCLCTCLCTYLYSCLHTCSFAGPSSLVDLATDPFARHNYTGHNYIGRYLYRALVACGPGHEPFRARSGVAADRRGHGRVWQGPACRPCCDRASELVNAPRHCRSLESFRERVICVAARIEGQTSAERRVRPRRRCPLFLCWAVQDMSKTQPLYPPEGA